MKLSHHPDYLQWRSTHSCGCGPENARFDLVPDTIYGLSIKEACCPHDHRFEIGGTIKEFDIANAELLINMLSIINDYKISEQIGVVEKLKCFIYPHFLARRRAMLYYEAVCISGYRYFNFTDKGFE